MPSFSSRVEDEVEDVIEELPPGEVTPGIE